MRHRNKLLKLGRASKEAREALVRSLLTSFVLHGKVTTTKPRAQAITRAFSELVTRVKGKEKFNVIRTLQTLLYTEEASRKFVDELLPKLEGKSSGFTRITLAGFRKGDNAPLAVVELL